MCFAFFFAFAPLTAPFRPPASGRTVAAALAARAGAFTVVAARAGVRVAATRGVPAERAGCCRVFPAATAAAFATAARFRAGAAFATACFGTAFFGTAFFGTAFFATAFFATAFFAAGFATGVAFGATFAATFTRPPGTAAFGTFGRFSPAAAGAGFAATIGVDLTAAAALDAAFGARDCTGTGTPGRDTPAARWGARDGDF